MTMQSAPAPVLTLQFHWPEMPEHPYREAVFFGAWHPKHALRLTCAAPPSGVVPATVAGRNWALVSTTAPDGAALVHAGDPAAGQVDAVAFRGYVLEPPLHCWAGSEPVLRYWSADHARHNGVFGAVVVDRCGGRLRLISDPFGVAPLFYRTLPDGVVLFANSPRYLVLPGDEPEPSAARVLFHMQALCGEISLTPGARRASPGTSLEFDANGKPDARRWFDLAALPPGDQPIDDVALDEMEAAFQVAMDRCLQLLPGGPVHLPLSSGDDSRRILVALLRRDVGFLASTVRIFQKGHRDLDARFATELARRFGFPHRIFELGGPGQYRRDDRDCRILFGSQLMEHSWLAPLIKGVKPGLSLLFDGLAGDKFGEEPWEAAVGPQTAADLYAMDESRKLELMAELAIPSTGSAILQERAWPPLETLRANLAEFLRQQSLPEGKNRSGLALILFRVCRSTALWTHHLLPTGCIPVFPYLDLDHALVTLRYDPLEKIHRTVQARCLERFWPEFYAVPGSRRIPDGLPPGSSSPTRRLALGRLDQLRAECGDPIGTHLAGRVKRRYRALAVASAGSRRLSQRVQWWLDPLLMLESHRLRMQTGGWRADLASLDRSL
jgi:hypothetical protein